MLKKSERFPFVQSRIDVTIPTITKNVTIENPIIKPYSSSDPADVSFSIRLMRNFFIRSFLYIPLTNYINSITNREFILIGGKIG